MDYTHYLNFIVVTILLVILGLLLKNWQPPIQRQQYIVMALLVMGAILGHFMIDSWAYGTCLAGLVFYKDKLVEEIKLVTHSYENLKEEVDVKKK